jgi:hypothetical protein
VQYSDDLYQAGPNHAEIENMHRSAYSGVSAARSRMSEVKATEDGQKLPTISCPNPLRFARDFAHSRRKHRSVTALAIGAPSFEAGGEDAAGLVCAGRDRRKRATVSSASLCPRPSAVEDTPRGPNPRSR